MSSILLRGLRLLLVWLCLSAVISLKCGAGDSCVFVNKDIGWVEYVPPTDARNADKPRRPISPILPGESEAGSKNPSAANRAKDWVVKGGGSEKATLQFSISSYRDKLCPRTVFNIFTRAMVPERIRVNVIQQNTHGEDIDCFEGYCELMRKEGGHPGECPFRDQIEVKRLDSRTALGPNWARAVGSQMLQQSLADKIHDKGAVLGQDSEGEGGKGKGRSTSRSRSRISLRDSNSKSEEGEGESIMPADFCMQTDAHMDFVPHFDRLMMHMWALADNEMAVLSTYVSSLEEYKMAEMAAQHEEQLLDDPSIAGEDMTKSEKMKGHGMNKLQEVPHLCMLSGEGASGAHGLPRNWGTKCARMLPAPKLTNAVWGAGLSFSKCHAELKVPYDPHLPFIFDGEEFSRAVRFFTWGYDIYSPHRTYVLHNYKISQSDPTHNQWYQNRGSHAGTAVEGVEKKPHPAGMGDTGVASVSVGEKDIHGADREYDQDGLPNQQSECHPKDVQASARRMKLLLDMPLPGAGGGEVEGEGGGGVEVLQKERHAVQRSKYGLGVIRTLQQVWAFSGINLSVPKVTANRCGNIDLVPYTPHPKGPEYMPVYDMLTEAYLGEANTPATAAGADGGGSGSTTQTRLPATQNLDRGGGVLKLRGLNVLLSVLGIYQPSRLGEDMGDQELTRLQLELDLVLGLLTLAFLASLWMAGRPLIVRLFATCCPGKMHWLFVCTGRKRPSPSNDDGEGESLYKTV